MKTELRCLTYLIAAVALFIVLTPRFYISKFIRSLPSFIGPTVARDMRTSPLLLGVGSFSEPFTDEELLLLLLSLELSELSESGVEQLESGGVGCPSTLVL